MSSSKFSTILSTIHDSLSNEFNNGKEEDIKIA